MRPSRVITRALQHAPRYARASVNLGHALAQLGRLDEASDTFRRALEIDPGLRRPISAWVLCWPSRQVGRSHRRIPVRTRGGRPDFPEAENNLGVVLAGKGLLDDAITAHRRALELNPRYADAAANEPAGTCSRISAKSTAHSRPTDRPWPSIPTNRRCTAT